MEMSFSIMYFSIQHPSKVWLSTAPTRWVNGNRTQVCWMQVHYTG